MAPAMEDERRRINAGGRSKVKLMCSYGGKIQPRPLTNKLMYVGGDTKLLTVDRNIKFSDILKRLISLFTFKAEDDVCIKYQLPGEDLDILISLINHDDLENMMVEYDRLHRILSPNNKPVRMRLFLSSVKNSATPSSDHAGSDAPINPDYLFGFDKDYKPGIPTKPAFDVDLWKIPCAVYPAAGKGSELDKRVLEEQVMIAHDGHVTGGMQGMVMNMGMMNGNCRDQPPIYNFVPATPSVPELMKMVVTHNTNVATAKELY